MIAIKSFARSEEAHLFAGWLRNQGIEADVLEESAVGGNLLAGTTPGTVRVEVPTTQEKKAHELATEYEKEMEGVMPDEV